MAILLYLPSGLMVFPIVFTFGLLPEAGGQLSFTAFPAVFGELTGGRVISIAFFILPYPAVCGGFYILCGGCDSGAGSDTGRMPSSQMGSCLHWSYCCYASGITIGIELYPSRTRSWEQAFSGLNGSNHRFGCGDRGGHLGSKLNCLADSQNEPVAVDALPSLPQVDNRNRPVPPIGCSVASFCNLFVVTLLIFVFSTLTSPRRKDVFTDPGTS